MTSASDPTENEIPMHWLPICDLCVAGEGGECHVPGCAFWAQRAPSKAQAAMIRAHLGLD